MKLQLICHLPSQGLNYLTKSSLAPNSHLLLLRLADTPCSARRLRIGRRAWTQLLTLWWEPLKSEVAAAAAIVHTSGVEHGVTA